MMTSREKILMGLALVAMMIAAASLTEAFVIRDQVGSLLNAQTKRADTLNSKVDALSAKMNQLSSENDDMIKQLTQLATNPGAGTRTIYMLALPDFGGDGYDKFSPEQIVVMRGDKVKLILTNLDDMDQGIGISGYGINAIVKGNERITIEFVADKPGVFLIYCTVPCGIGHSEMTGQLIVIG